MYVAADVSRRTILGAEIAATDVGGYINGEG
jgi:hypothetical protein